MTGIFRKKALLLTGLTLLAGTTPYAFAEDLSRGWNVVRQDTYAVGEPPSGNAKGVDVETFRSRAYRLTNFYEPSQLLWLERSFTAPATVSGEYVVLSVGNAPTVEKVFFNGKPLKNIAQTFHHKPNAGGSERLGPFPDEWKFPWSTDGADAATQRDKLYTDIRFDKPALFLIPKSQLQPGANRLTLAAWDFDDYRTHTLLGGVELRAPRLSETLELFGYSRPKGDFGTEGVVGVKPRLPLTGDVSATIAVQDYFGNTLRTEQVTLKLDGEKPIEHALPVSTGEEYKAVVTVSRGGETMRPFWVYYAPRLVKTAADTKFSLEASDWQYRPFREDETLSFPLAEPASNSRWAWAHIPGIAANGWNWRTHRVLLRKSFQVPQGFAPSGQRTLLRVGGLQQKGEIYLNGQRVGELSYTEGTREFDVAKFLKSDGPNEIVVLLHDYAKFLSAGTPALKDTEGAPRGTSLGANEVMTIRDEISLVAVPQVRVQRNWVRTSVKNKSLWVKTWLENTTGAPVTVNLDHSVRLKNAPVLALPKQTVTIPANSTKEVEVTQAWANPQLWAPWSPNLYQLQTRATVNGALSDLQEDRFGFREITIEGTKLRLNGQIVHLIAGRDDHSSRIAHALDFAKEADNLRDLHQAGFNMTREWLLNTPAQLWSVFDEIGLFGNANGGPSDMGQGTVDYNNWAAHETSLNLYRNYALEHYNHPSIILWNYGNEFPTSLHPKLAENMARVADGIKQFDPTRILTTDGSGDGLGRIETHNMHYSSRRSYDMFPKATQEYITFRRNEGGPPAPEGSGVYGHPWEGTKPLIDGEYNWLHHDTLLYDGLSITGEAAMKPTAKRGREDGRWNTAWLTDQHAVRRVQRQMEMLDMRVGPHAGFVMLDTPFASYENYRPILAHFYDNNTRLWSGEPIKQLIPVVNDSGRDAAIDIKLTYELNGKTVNAFAQTVNVTQGGKQFINATIPAITVTQPTTVRARLTSSTRRGAQSITQSEVHRVWTVFPKNFTGATTGVAVSLFDPNKSTAGIFEALGVKPRVLPDLNGVGALKGGVLVLGENIDAKVLGKAAESLGEFASKGGQVLVLRQKDLSWMPAQVEVNKGSTSGTAGRITQIYAVGHPVFAGLLPEDFRYWGDLGAVRVTAMKPVGGSNIRTLAGLVPNETTMFEMASGTGRYVVTTLELTPTNVRSNPVVARLFANILRYGAVPEAPKAKTLVINGGTGERAKQLQDVLKIDADFTDKEPVSLAGYNVAMLVGYENEGGAVPSNAFKPKLRAFVENGGTLIAQQVSPALQKWLSEALGRPIESNPVISVRTVKAAHDPLLWGLSDGDMMWHNLDYRFDPYIKNNTGEHDLVRREVIPQGAKVLTYPGTLNVTNIGKGRLLIDQSLWTEVSNKTRLYWGFDSRKQAQRMQANLLRNVGVNFKVPPRPQAQAGVVSLAFAPLDIAKSANRGMEDEKANDGKGWLDLGFPFNLRVEPGRLVAGEVPFTIIEEAKNGGNNVIALRSGKRFKELPEVTQKIPVNANAKSLFFLSTTGYNGSKDGEPVWEYEVQYEGFSALIPGTDTSNFVSRLPVRSAMDVADWLGTPRANPTWKMTDPKLTGNGSGQINLWVQRWDNPRPDRKIESIQIKSLQQEEVPFILGITVGQEANNLLNGATSKMQPASIQWKGDKVAEQRGKIEGWGYNAWDNTTTADIAIEPDPVEKINSIALRNVKGRQSVQFYIDSAWSKIALQPRKKYRLSFYYQTTGGGAAGATWTVTGNTAEKKRLAGEPLPRLASEGRWSLYTTTIEVPEAGMFSINFGANDSQGKDQTFYVRDIWLTEAD